MLDGKCKIDFDQWYIENIIGIPFTIGFDYLHPSMIFGLYIDFFKHKDTHIFIVPEQVGEWELEYAFHVWEFDSKGHLKQIYNSFHGHGAVYGGAWDLTKTRTEAIKKANEIYNKTYNEAKQS